MTDHQNMSIRTVEAAAIQMSNLLVVGDPIARTALGGWFTSFIQSVAERVAFAKPLSTKQRDHIVRAIKAYYDALPPGHTDRPDLDALIRNPVCVQEPYSSQSYPREARYLGVNKVAMRFKPDPTLLSTIKMVLKGRFDVDHRVWVVTISEQNMEEFGNALLNFDFHFDDAVVSLLAEFEALRKQPAGFIVDDENDVILGVCGTFLAEWAEYVAGGDTL
jgi:hypothetical protein